MNVILVLGNVTPRAVSYINSSNGVSINIQRAANTIDEIETFLVRTLTKTDLLVLTDAALGTDYMNSIIKIKAILDKGFLSVGQIIHLTLTQSTVSASTEHVLSDYNLKVVKRDKLTLKTVLDAITGELIELKETTAEKSLVNVVRVRKNSRDVAIFEESTANDSVIITTKKNIDIEDKLDAIDNIKEAKGRKQIPKYNQKIAPNRLGKVDPSLQEPNLDAIAHPNIKGKGIEKGTTLVITGERKSGKTVLTQALALGYSKDYKVLLISDTDSMSDTVTENALSLSVLDFKDNLSAAITKATSFDNKLTILNDFREIPEDILYTLLDIIYFNIKDNYDIILIDTQLTKYIETPGIAANTNLICLTSPLYVTSINSMAKFLSNISIYLHKSYFLYVPTDIFHSVGGLKKYKVSAAREAIVNALKHDNVKTLQELKFLSLNAGQPLLDIVTPHIKKAVK